MRYVAYRSSSSLPSLLPFRPIPLQHKAPKLQILELRNSYRFCSHAPVLQVSLRTTNAAGGAAMSDHLLSLAATTQQRKPGDISVFLQTAGVLLFAYWIANFVVPDLIIKYMGFDKMGDQEQDTTTNKPKPKAKEGDNAVEEEKEKEKASSQSKKRGFNSSSSSRARRIP